MSMQEQLTTQLRKTQRYFRNTASSFSEEDSGFAPTEEMFTVAAQVAHAADTLDWFVEGAFGRGWDMDFEALNAKAKAVTSFTEAMAWLDRAFDGVAEVISESDEETLQAPIPNDQLMGGMPRAGIVPSIVDHTAHHRGSLAIYARLLGRVPAMPYS
ncbi:MAG: DinB family protein [Gemmatimonadetes bacterium]|nr:DinB family protein [Gemmatimonadota bacterium]